MLYKLLKMTHFKSWQRVNSSKSIVICQQYPLYRPYVVSSLPGRVVAVVEVVALVVVLVVVLVVLVVVVVHLVDDDAAKLTSAAASKSEFSDYCIVRILTMFMMLYKYTLCLKIVPTFKLLSLIHI